MNSKRRRVIPPRPPSPPLVLPSSLSFEGKKQEREKLEKEEEREKTTTCVICKCTFNTSFCATSLTALKALLFDRIVGHSRLELPGETEERKRQKKKKRKSHADAAKDEILLPLCETGKKSRGKEEREGDEYEVGSAHWICTSCMATTFLQTNDPKLVSANYLHHVEQNFATTFTQNRAKEENGKEEEEDEEEKDRKAKLLFCDTNNCHHVHEPSLDINDTCPCCNLKLSATSITMFLAICQSQQEDYIRMRQCWLAEVVRNVKMRKLIRDMQHYLLFDESMHSSRLQLENQKHSYCVTVERVVDLPQHLRDIETPTSEQKSTEILSTVKYKRGNSIFLSGKVPDLPPVIASTDIKDAFPPEPRERWLFEALNLHDDFDEATMPINGNSLTEREQRALRRALRHL